MGSPYDSVSVSGYNSNPPSDDGSSTEANRVKWSTIKTKLPDPLKTAIEAVNTNTLAAFAKVIGGAGVNSTSISYQILSSDRGKLVRASSSGITLTTPDATDVGSPWVCMVLNNSTGDVTVDGSGSQTVNGTATVTLGPGEGGLLVTDGTNWFLCSLRRSITVRDSGFSMYNGILTATANAGALTIAIKGQDGNDPSSTNPVVIIIRDATASSGGFNVITLTAATSLVLSGGSTLGTTNNVAFRLWVVGFNDAGTFRLGVINCRSGTDIYPLGVHAIVSSTAEGGSGGADSAHVFYTGTAVTSKAYQVLGHMTWETGLGTAGSYSAGPTRIQLMNYGGRMPGDRVQVAISQDGAVATGTTQIPSDNSIPQNTEGDQYMSKAITPSSAANVLMIDHRGVYSHNAASGVPMTAALFQDSTAGALASVTDYTVGQVLVAAVALMYAMVAGTTSSTTMKIRAGTNTAGTTTFNGSSGSRLQGGVMASHLRIEEIMA